MKPKKVSKILLKRLTLYLDHLQSLPDDVTYVSATSIAKALDLGDVQVRKDLARVSGGGKCKIGHMRDRLIRDLDNYLNFGDTTNAIVIGAGKLGKALLDYQGFEPVGINLVAGFDIRPEKDLYRNTKPIYAADDLEDFCAIHYIKIAILAVPEEAAQEMCDRLVDCGIRAIWNFTPVHLIAPDYIAIQNENLAISLAALRMQLK